jgi:tetratricopeptide (TPR) repeat protein
MADPTDVQNWRDVTLHAGVLRESAAKDSRLVLWLPVERDRHSQHWQRVSTAADAEASEREGIVALAATMIRARQPIDGLFGRWLRRLRRSGGDNAWLIPNGAEAQQQGGRQTDLLLVWAKDDGRRLDEATIRRLWPQSGRIQSLGPRLFLVEDATEKAATAADTVAAKPLSEEPLGKRADERLAAARRSGDRAEEATALADLGLFALDEGNLPQAIAYLEEALVLSRALADQAREGDVLGILGLVFLRDGRAEDARRHLEQALLLERAAGDHFSEKLILERLATIQAFQGDLPGGIRLLDDALALARTLGDRQHEADLLWHLAILRAESGQPKQAIAQGQASIDLLRALDKPQADVYAEHLEKYRGTGKMPVPRPASAICGWRFRPRRPSGGLSARASKRFRSRRSRIVCGVASSASITPVCVAASAVVSPTSRPGCPTKIAPSVDGKRPNLRGLRNDLGTWQISWQCHDCSEGTWYAQPRATSSLFHTHPSIGSGERFCLRAFSLAQAFTPVETRPPYHFLFS